MIPPSETVRARPRGAQPLSAAQPDADADTNYNYEIQPPQVENLTQQPAIRIDYQLSSKLRLNGKYSGQRARADHHARA